MAENETVSQESYTQLEARVSELEQRLSQYEQGAEGPEPHNASILEESTNIMRGFMKASINAVNESLGILSGIAGEKDGERAGLTDNIMHVMHGAVDAQQKALEKFESAIKKQSKPAPEKPS